MFTKVHDRLGTASLIVAIIAIVAALSGVALAKSVIITKLSQISPSVQKKLKGATGPVGPQGPTGLQGGMGEAGAKGDTGAPGKDGIDGESGACSVTVPKCVLPPNATLKGLWQLQTTNTAPSLKLITISFPLRVEPGPEYEWVPVGTEPEDNENCPGSADNPQAEPGFFCLYPKIVLGTSAEEPNEFASVPPLGFRGVWETEGETTLAYGSWAVTAK